jgi:hypothetical protein
MFDVMFDELNKVDEAQANNFLSYYWDFNRNFWNEALIDEFALRLISSVLLNLRVSA